MGTPKKRLKRSNDEIDLKEDVGYTTCAAINHNPFIELSLMEAFFKNDDDDDMDDECLSKCFSNMTAKKELHSAYVSNERLDSTMKRSHDCPGVLQYDENQTCHAIKKNEQLPSTHKMFGVNTLFEVNVKSEVINSKENVSTNTKVEHTIPSCVNYSKMTNDDYVCVPHELLTNEKSSFRNNVDTVFDIDISQDDKQKADTFQNNSVDIVTTQNNTSRRTTRGSKMKVLYNVDLIFGEHEDDSCEDYIAEKGGDPEDEDYNIKDDLSESESDNVEDDEDTESEKDETKLKIEFKNRKELIKYEKKTGENVILEQPATTNQTLTEQPTTSKQTLTEQPSTSKQTITEQPSTCKQTLTEQPSIIKQTLTEQPSIIKQLLTEQPTTSKQTLTEQPSIIKQTLTEQPTTSKQTLTEQPETSKHTLTEQTTPSKLNGHEVPTVVVEDEYVYSCPICPCFPKSNNVTLFTNHLVEHFGQLDRFGTDEQRQLYRVIHKSKRLREIYMVWMKIAHPPENPTACTKCGKIFPTELKCKYHESHIHVPYIHKCDKCDKVYKTRFQLTRHKLSNHSSDERKISCDQCANKFFSQHNLNQHLLRHKEKYYCEQCGKCFRSKTNLVQHTQSLSHLRVVEDGKEIEVRDFLCEACGVKFGSKQHLRQHFKSNSHRVMIGEPVDDSFVKRYRKKKKICEEEAHKKNFKQCRKKCSKDNKKKK